MGACLEAAPARRNVGMAFAEDSPSVPRWHRTIEAD
jgi:hypothetical protein